MDGAELVYEPTLEHVFQNNALVATEKPERPGHARVIIPLSRSPQPESLVAPTNAVAARSRFALQIAAGFVMAVVAFMAFYAAPRLFQTKAQTSTSTIETRGPNSSLFSPVAFDSSMTTDKPETGNTKLQPSSDKSETQNAKPETSLSSDKPETRNAKRETAFPALPGLKPLPRLKPLPTLKPLPGLRVQSPPLNASRKAAVVNTKVNTKKESRFGAFLKKTGRILTKPFKS